MQSAVSKSEGLRIAYLGPQASFSHQAALEAFATVDQASFAPLSSFPSLLEAIQVSASDTKGKDGNAIGDLEIDYALIPVENSTNGGVVPVLDLLVKCGENASSSTYPDIEIVAEHYLQVHHCLFVHESVTKGNTFDGDLKSLNITTLFSHLQVWGQCGKFLSANLPAPDVERIDMSSTSAAATFIAQNTITEAESGHKLRPDAGSVASTNTTPDQISTPKASKQGNKAAICSSLAGIQNNLVKVATNIEDEPGRNTTRFLIIRNRRRKYLLPLPSSKDQPTGNTNTLAKFSFKSLVTFTISHETPGSLAHALSIFSKHQFNLTAITTRPSRQNPWHYVFFVECEEERCSRDDDFKVHTMFEELSRVTERCDLLGSWLNKLKHNDVGF